MRRNLILTLIALSAIAIPAGGQARDEKPEVATIAASATTTGVIDLGNRCLTGIQLPAAFTGATITATAAVPDGNGTLTYVAIYQGDGTTQWSIPFNASRFVDLTQKGKAICGPRFIKLVSNASEAAARTLLLQTAR